ncbi:cell wall integrity and stress response component 1-like isoform X1 [Pecten maximus]|uniref:cell wall integrity and stress response component 1-like isoform X1 n=1 Tax=Pecten maximus TaxID=6579 RepID=UPI001458AB5E|nr:cell wall integrity and stress response component 1-like isoform X1 [Pecten maximus]
MTIFGWKVHNKLKVETVQKRLREIRIIGPVLCENLDVGGITIKDRRNQVICTSTPAQSSSTTPASSSPPVSEGVDSSTLETSTPAQSLSTTPASSSTSSLSSSPSTSSLPVPLTTTPLSSLLVSSTSPSLLQSTSNPVSTSSPSSLSTLQPSSTFRATSQSQAVDTSADKTDDMTTEQTLTTTTSSSLIWPWILSSSIIIIGICCLFCMCRKKRRDTDQIRDLEMQTVSSMVDDDARNISTENAQTSAGLVNISQVLGHEVMRSSSENSLFDSVPYRRSQKEKSS